MVRRASLVAVTGACAALTAVLGAAALATASHLSGLPTAAWGPGALNQAVVLAAAAVGAVGCAWHALSGLLALLALGPRAVARRSTGSAQRAAQSVLSRWGAPLVRRLAAGSLALGSVASPALAASLAPDDLGWASCASASCAPGPDDVGWAPPSGAGPDPDSPPGSARTLTVTPGDSLWSLTEQVLDRPGSPPATAAQVARAWPLVYEANRQAIGADPSLIRPGTQLLIPSDIVS